MTDRIESKADPMHPPGCSRARVDDGRCRCVRVQKTRKCFVEHSQEAVPEVQRVHQISQLGFSSARHSALDSVACCERCAEVSHGQYVSFRLVYPNGIEHTVQHVYISVVLHRVQLEVDDHAVRVVSVHGVLAQISEFSHIHEIGGERDGPQIVVAKELLVMNNLCGGEGVIADERVWPVSGPHLSLAVRAASPATWTNETRVVSHSVLSGLQKSRSWSSRRGCVHQIEHVVLGKIGSLN
ncbi:hypothetical protein QKD39_gp36 [Psittacine adenovirus 1]|uniref:Uncharacterized protein n=1 Tax=Psittacine adenovirus 1 TaxID=318592 RepID=A0A2Z5E065_9ADEN|nr:hypothetical protein QKD39_gp36 [Psittacine adenovirus 1]AXB73053.1 hypothetical protein [Psittacine adenovirus 1]